MTENRTDEIAMLLTRAGEAHGVYEETVLNGVYDMEWAAWYAKFLVENGIGDLLGQSVTIEAMTTFLTQADEQHKAAGADEHWTRFYGRSLAETRF